MNRTLLSALWPESMAHATNKVMLVLAGVALLTLSAKIQVPFWPVPMTLQTLAVLLIGATYGARLAGSTLIAYLAAGAVGVPVFATGAGLAYMAGPTAGYLAGFLVAAVVVGWLADRGHGRGIVSALVVFAIGEVAIFALGTGWLSVLIGPDKAVSAGLLPFIPGEALKLALATAVLSAGWKQAKS
ncbi:MAG: biotin transporter BioY [Alphaproteobacteria bacterium]|nr:biotin transporter BioY [Alphaproteobacteria bacterium]